MIFVTGVFQCELHTVAHIAALKREKDYRVLLNTYNDTTGVEILSPYSSAYSEVC